MSDDTATDAWLRHITGWPFVNHRPKRLGVAVSGGGDSMALLDLMLWQGREAGFPVEAVTVDHGLRPEAASEATAVARFCEGRGVRHEVLRWGGWDGQGNLQNAAREARYRLIADWARGRGVDWVALGHTKDDQAETVLMRIARKSGVDGLAGMESRFRRHGLTWIRPLLGDSRDELRAYLARHDIGWSEDPSNDDDGFERIRARKVLAALAPLGIDVDTLHAVAFNAATAKWALEHYTAVEADRLTRQDHGDVILPERPFPPIPGEIERRILVAAIRWVGGGAYPPRAEAMVNMSAEMSRCDRHTLAGCVVTREHDARRRDTTLRITREWNAVKDMTSPTDQTWDGRWQLKGPHAPDLQIRALGDAGLQECPDWRDTGLPRVSLLASPAVWRQDTLISAPIAGYGQGWTAKLAPERDDFAKSLLSR